MIFDLDGVLVSTDECHYQAWKCLADRENIPFDRSINERLRGVSRMQSLEIILERAQKKYDDAQKAEMAEFKNGVYRTKIMALTPNDILPGVPELLALLRSKGKKLAVGSSSKNTRTIMERIGLWGAFDAVADGTDIAKSKPDPEVFLVAAAKLGLPADRCVVVEDAYAGIAAGKAAGMKTVGVGTAQNCPDADFGCASLADERLKEIF